MRIGTISGAAAMVLGVMVGACADPADEPTGESASGQQESTTTSEAPTTTTTAPPTTTTTIPQPVVYEGTGTQVIEIQLPNAGEAAAATITHTGGGNFAIWELDANLEQVDLAVNTIGDYSGTVALNLAGDSTTSSLEITAGGAWRVEVKSLLSLRQFDSGISGTGDDVLLYAGESHVVALSHQGQSNFAIWFHGENDSDLMANEIGTYNATVPLNAGPAVLVITADGPWSITRA